MKVYIVSAGSYSDWHIKGIFLDQEKAEKYNAIVQDSNTVEEYDTMDDQIIVPVYYIYATYETKNVPLGYENHLYKTKGAYGFSVNTTNSADVCEYEKNHTGYWSNTITICRQISKLPESDEEYEALKSKYHKVCADLAAIVENELANGATEDQVSKLLGRK